MVIAVAAAAPEVVAEAVDGDEAAEVEAFKVHGYSFERLVH